MKKFVAFILVLALCLSLCSVALATPAPEEPSSCNVNILHAIGTYWIARTIVERAKEIKAEMPDLAQFWKLALPVGIAAVGTAATVGIIYALLKGNCDKEEDVKTFATVAELMEAQENFPSDYDNGWQESNKNALRMYYKNIGFDQLIAATSSADNGISVANEYTEIVKSGNNYLYAPDVGEWNTVTVTFIMDGTKITSIEFCTDIDVEYAGTFTAPPQ